jgi:hypothetical protein
MKDFDQKQIEKGMKAIIDRKGQREEDQNLVSHDLEGPLPNRFNDQEWPFILDIKSR